MNRRTLLGFLATTVGYAAVPGWSLGSPRTPRVDRVVVNKAKRELLLLSGGKTVRRYRIALGFAPKGDKVREGDGKTPEGRYRITWRNPKSAFTLSLKISYPDRSDRARARKAGVDPGGDIFIHGPPTGRDLGKDHYRRDWTLGCMAVTEAEIREIWRLVPIGTPIDIRP
jgi:murein L,D-transpeptidase YafK